MPDDNNIRNNLFLPGRAVRMVLLGISEGTVRWRDDDFFYEATIEKRTH